MANYTRNAIYDKLRTIDVSVETADILAEELVKYSSKKVDAFILWAMGYNQDEAALIAGCSRREIQGVIYGLRCKMSISRPVKVRGE